MVMKHRRMPRTLACASLLVLATLPSAANAQQISRIIVFGDVPTRTAAAGAVRAQAATASLNAGAGGAGDAGALRSRSAATV